MSYMRVKVKLQPQNKEVDALEIPIDESIEKFTIVKLDDGTTLSIKASPIRVARLIDQHDPQGNPVYNIESANIISIVQCPDELKRRT